MTSTKISTHSSNPDILVSASAVDLAGNQLHMHDPVSHEYTTQLVGLLTNSDYKYSCSFERWLGPDYLFPFQTSVDVFVLGCRVELLRFAKFWLQIPRQLPGTYLFYPSFPLNEHIQQIIQWVQDPPISLFTLQELFNPFAHLAAISMWTLNPFSTYVCLSQTS